MTLKKFNFNVIAKDKYSRCGLVETHRGNIKTPAFMPDGTQVEAEEVNPPTAETVPDDYSPTYKKPDGATEKTIYSVRYVELLAFLAKFALSPAIKFPKFTFGIFLIFLQS